MTPRTDQGCGTPQDASRKRVHQRLVQLFAPLVHFHPEERFFPVELPATIRMSSLWKVDPSAKPPTSKRVDSGGIKSTDLTGAGANHYTTVPGTGAFQKTVDGRTVSMPTPQIDRILEAYRKDGNRPRLTMYGTVCKATDVPNQGLVSWNAADSGVRHALTEGLIVNYYLYFPATESAEFDAEGDWAGISLLLKETPAQVSELENATRLERYLPVIACYYRKSIDGAPPAPGFVAGKDGFRRWKDVKRGRDASVGKDTHPFVYVSKGRHNCHYAPGASDITLSPPWSGTFSADAIEAGKLTFAPGGQTITGTTDIPWWVYVLVPPLAPIQASATGCEEPYRFDRSGLPPWYMKGKDESKAGGYEGLPGSTSTPYPKSLAPSGPASSRQVGVELRYVDLTDATTAAQWGYAGAWGGATLWKAWPDEDPSKPQKGRWGYYRGARRPALAAWLLWNLFMDRTFGSGGSPPVTPGP